MIEASRLRIHVLWVMIQVFRRLNFKVKVHLIYACRMMLVLTQMCTWMSMGMCSNDPQSGLSCSQEMVM